MIEQLQKLYGSIVHDNTEDGILTELTFTADKERISFTLQGHNKYDILGKLISNRQLFAEIHKKYCIKEIISIDFGSPMRLVLIDGLKKDAFIPVISKEVITDYDVLAKKVGVHLGTEQKELHIEHAKLGKPILTAKELADRYINFDKVTYQPSSESPAIGSVIPSNMATEINKVLNDIEAKHGSVDRFVMLKLGYQNKEELYEAFAGEQVDALAMQIVQMEGGNAFINGFATGVGKGRLCAGMIRYSIKQGKVPIFFTEKANLFSDLYRDLKDIGCEYYRPFIVNDKSGDNDPTIVDEFGFIVHKTPPAIVKRNAYKNGIVPHGFDFIMATYSQFASSKPSDKKMWMAKVATDNHIYMDESHNVSGDSNSGEYFQYLLRLVEGCCFFSATWAKRPDNMVMYAAKTTLKEADMGETSLMDVFKKAGVPMQEIASAQLVESGQMARLERDFTGVENYFSVLKKSKDEHWETWDAISEIIRMILWFENDYIKPMIGDIAAELKDEGKKVNHAPYSARVFNIVDQALFSIKAVEVAESAIKALQSNRKLKPVITFKSTMEAFLKNGEYKVGDFIPHTNFELSLIKGLEGILNYTIRDADDDEAPKERRTIEFDELSGSAQMAYGEIMTKIANCQTSISISPIDVIIQKITEAGYKIGEITGRKMQLAFQPDGGAVVKAREERDLKKIVRSFNHGEGIDVVLINQSGAAGLSLHASAKFKDQRQRAMLVGQFQLDIAKAIQILGRTDRSGQICRSMYFYLTTTIPAESRLMAIYKRKLNSLMANTSSSQKSDNGIESVDFLNKYGDQIIVEYLKENRDINAELQDPLRLDDMGMDELNKLKTVENAAHKVTGRIAILPCADQETFYNVITQRYTDFIQYLNDTDTNDLEVRVLPLDAVKIAQRPYMYGSGGLSPFGQDSIIEKIEANILKKPLTKAELEEQITDHLKGLFPAQKQKVLIDVLDKYYLGREKEVIEYVTNKYMNKKQEASEKYKTPELLNGTFKILVSQEKVELSERKTRLDHDKQFVRKVFVNFMVGDEYDVPSVVSADTLKVSRGIFLGVKLNHSTVNPFAPSNLIMVFATLDGRRIVQVPLSITDWINALLKSRDGRVLPDIPLRDEWGNVHTDSAKETRYVITGNILQAYNNLGQLVAYTTHEGHLKKGILMPMDFRPDDHIMVPAMQALQSVKDMEVNMTIESAKKEVVITRLRGIKYNIGIPATKTIGGLLYNDKTLISLLSTKFIQDKGKMTALFDMDNLDDMFLLFAEKFKLRFKVKYTEISSEVSR